MNTRSQVIKRDGSVVDYQPEKVRKALESAGLPETVRSEQLTLDELSQLANLLF
jgi:transcriptional regulator NrdR family protein